MRAGDAAEDLACAMLADELSPQACDWRVGRHSVSEDETREPEPVLPSESAVAPANVLLPSREAAAAAAKVEPIGLLFQMLLAQGIELKEERSLSVLLRDTPPEKSRFRDCRRKRSVYDAVGGGRVRTLPAMAAMLWKRRRSECTGVLKSGVSRGR